MFASFLDKIAIVPVLQPDNHLSRDADRAALKLYHYLIISFYMRNPDKLLVLRFGNCR